MNIKSVTIEGMHNVEKKTYNFNQLNYLFGHNGAGKSTVLQSIQLALLGYIPGMNKTKESIFSNSNSHTMAVTLVVQDESSDITIRRVWTNSGKTINSTLYVSPEGYHIEDIIGDLELPIFNFNEFVGMTANKLKDWFIGFLPSTSNEINWDKELTESTKSITIVDDKLIPNAVQEITHTGLKGVDQVRKANDYFKSALSFKKQELQRVQSTVQSLIFYDNCSTDLSEDDIKEEIVKLNEEKTECIKKRATKENYIKVQDRNSKIYSQISALNLKSDCAENDPTYINCKDKFEELTKLIESYNESATKNTTEGKDIEQLLQERMSLINERNMKNKIIESGGVCQYTDSKCESILNMIEDLKSDVDVLDESIKKYDSMIHDYKVNMQEINSKIKEANDSKSKLYADMRHIEDMYRSRELLQKQIESFDAEVSDISTEDIEDRIDRIEVDLGELSNTLVMLAANKKYTELTETLSNQKFEIEQSIEAIKIWEKLTGANGLQTKMMNEPFIKFVGKLNTYIKPLFGDEVSAKFNLIEKANSFSFGIERNNAYIPYDLLSSGEKCMFMLAMMICIVDDSSSQLKLIMVDDLFDHLDDNNVNKLFDSLYKVTNIQFIVAGVKNVASNEFVIEVK